MEKETTTIRVDKTQLDRAKKLKKEYNIPIKEMFEQGLLFYENTKELGYKLLLKEQKEIEDKIISNNALIKHQRRELKIVANTYHETIKDVLCIWKESGKELDDFCNDREYLEYLAKVMGKYNRVKDMTKLKRVLSEKKNF